jgi:undecaprenyl-diphosphatase
MSLLQATILGLIQGLTEFIPVSSTGHLVLVRELFGWEDMGIAFDTVLHLGTLLAVIIYFWSTWKSLLRTAGLLIASLFKPSCRKKTEPSQVFLLAALAVATIPAVIVGYWARDFIDVAFRNIIWVAIFLIVTGTIFIFMERGRRYFKRLAEKKQRLRYGLTEFKNLSWGRIILIGIMQSFALLPGISRSGFTIAGGVFSGLTREAAAKFAFLLSAPIIFGAGLIGLYDIYRDGLEKIGVWSLVIGFLVALISGYFAIRFLLKFIRSHKLYIFSVYLFVLAVVILIITQLS